VIEQQISQQKADLLVMFAHEKGFFEKLFKGSRTEEMSNLVQVPLLIFHK